MLRFWHVCDCDTVFLKSKHPHTSRNDVCATPLHFASAILKSYGPGNRVRATLSRASYLGGGFGIRKVQLQPKTGGVSQRVRGRLVLTFLVEKEAEILDRKNVVELTANRVDRIIRQYAGGPGNFADGEGATVGGDLPLVVTDHAQLQQLAHVLLEGKNLRNAPFIGEGLPWGLGRIVRASPASVTSQSVNRLVFVPLFFVI